MTELQKMGAAAKKAAAVLRTAGENKRTALNAAAAALRARQAEILAANKEDLKAAKENGMSEAMLDRLALTPARIEGMAKGVEDVSAQRDPVGRILSGETNPKGLKVEKNHGADGCYRHHLRSSSERDERRGCAVPYGGQCRHSARRQGSVPLQ